MPTDPESPASSTSPAPGASRPTAIAPRSATGLQWPASRRGRVQLTVLLVVVLVGCIDAGQRASAWATRAWSTYDLRFDGGMPTLARRGRGAPYAKLPGPPREAQTTFRLDDSTAQRMVGHNDPLHERWSDLAGNHYASEFCRAFTYEGSADAPTAPHVLVRVDESGPTLSGRLEAHGLKPNFAYQIKLLGDWRYPDAAEAIGFVGRWRLPGGGTNFTDEQFRAFPAERLDQVEAYVLFDYFITDAEGNASRDFALDSSLHVLWNVARQQTAELEHPEHHVVVEVDASNPALYAKPRATPERHSIIAEREHGRYPTDRIISLPPGEYHAMLSLTEESWHSVGNDDGFWATVAALPIRFVIK